MEAASGYKDFKELHSYINKNIGNFRLFAEKTKQRTSAITDRSFEYTPYISKGKTLEGIYGPGALGFTFLRVIDHDIFINHKVTKEFYEYLLEFNIGWFIASNPKTIKQLKKDHKFKAIYKIGIYQIFKLNFNRNSYVKVIEPPIYKLDKNLKEWKIDAKKYFKKNEQLKYHFVYTKENEKFSTVKDLGEITKKNLKTINNCISKEELKDQSFSFQTKCLNKPHIIKISYFPDWQVKGAEKIYMVSPGFMLIYPNSEEVILEYKRDKVNIFSNILFFLALVIIIISLFRKKLISEEKTFSTLSKRSIIVLAIVYLYFLVPETYYLKFRYFIDKQVLSNAEYSFENAEYKKTTELLEKIRNKSLMLRRRFLASKAYYHLKDYKKFDNNFYNYLNKSKNSDKIAELRYYYTLTKLEQKIYKHFMHEVYMINNLHADTNWAQKIRNLFNEWKKDNPKIYEKYKKYYK